MADKDTAFTGVTPPQAPDIERAVLGAMLFDRTSIGIAVEEIGKVEDCFYKPANALIFRAVTDLYDENFPVDQLTVTERLRQRGTLDQVGGEAAIAALSGEITSAANVSYHCRILKEKAFLRRIIAVTTSARGMCAVDTADPATILSTLEENIFRLAEMRSTKGYEAISDSVHNAYAEIIRRAETKEGLTGVDTGFDRLNHLTAGWQPSDLIILAGRPSMGKTAFALDLVKNAASKGFPVAMFSLEMSSVQLVMRMLYNEGRFDGSSANIKSQRPDDWSRLSDACARLQEYPIYIDDTPGLSISELSAKAKRLKNERGLRLLVVDYLQLMQGSSRESRQQEISSISRGMKILAKELNIPVIALSQLSRSVEQRTGDRKPLLSDLRESGAIEQDADIVMFIYRASVYGINPEYQINDQNVSPADVAEIIVRKQRNGPIGTVLLHWTSQYMKFNSFDYERTDEYF